MDNNTESVQAKVMDAITCGKVRMRPRWHFILYSLFALVGTLIVFFSLLYAASLCVFFLRQNGGWFAPSLGGRGWFELLHSLPWLLILLILIFIVLLEILVRRYAFVYKKPLLTSFLVIVLVMCLGGVAIARTSFHHHLEMYARHGQLPPPMGMWYQKPFRTQHSPDMFRGVILGTTTGGLVIFDPDVGTSTILIGPRTRRPYGEDFAEGELIIVVGDAVSTGTIRAYGLREIEE